MRRSSAVPRGAMPASCTILVSRKVPGSQRYVGARGIASRAFKRIADERELRAAVSSFPLLVSPRKANVLPGFSIMVTGRMS